MVETVFSKADICKISLCKAIVVDYFIENGGDALLTIKPRPKITDMFFLEQPRKINYNGLNQGAKGQHDTARRFIAQAEDALKSKNLVFARYLADKAENISASLINR